MDFERLFGNRETVAALCRGVREATLPHAYLIVGPEGSGKHTLARELCAALNCERAGEGGALPCGRCNTCRRVLSGQFTDMKTLSVAEGKATVGVEEVRVFREDMFLSATESEYKIYIFDGADRLTPQAQNALLKVLEEPPERVLILLLAESADKILITVKSRAPMLRMQKFSTKELSAYLLRESAKAEELHERDPKRYAEVLLGADGVIGAALSLLDERAIGEKERERECVEKLLSALSPATPYSRLYEALSTLPAKRAEFSRIVELLLVALRDLILIKQDDGVNLLYFTDVQNATEAARKLDQKRIVECKDLFYEALVMATQNANMTTTLSLLGAKLKK